MPLKFPRKSLLWPVILLLLSMTLAACGDSATSVSLSLPTEAVTAPTASSTTPGPTSQAVAATATPVASESARSGNTVPPTTGIASATSGETPSAVATTEATVAATPPASTPTPRPAIKPVTGFPGKLSILGVEDALYVARFDGSQPLLVAGNANGSPGTGQDGVIFRWPTWTNDGSKLAVIGFNVKSGQVVNSDIVVISQDGKSSYKVQDGGPEQPIYLSWSPDGNFLTMLVQSSNSLELRLADTSKGKATTTNLRKVSNGSAIYTGWSPDSQQLLIHTSTSLTDSTLSLLAAKDTKAQAVQLKATPTSFRAPAFSQDGSKLAFATLNSQTSNEDVSIHDKKGNPIGVIESGGRGVEFNWAPAGNKLAFTYLIPNGQGLYKGIALADLGTGNPANGKYTSTQVVNEALTSFFWSPDGKKLAYITLSDDSTMLSWKLYDLDSKKTSTVIDWYPSDPWLQLIQFYDQYAQSNSVWSPDSKSLVFSGYTRDEINALKGVDNTDNVHPTVYIVAIDGPQAGKAVPVAPGTMAFWSK